MQTTTSKNPVLVNLSWIVFANIFVKPLWFFFLVFSARILGPEDFGKFNFSVSFVLIFSILYELGMDLFTVREVSINKQLSPKLLGTSLIIKCFLVPVVTLIIILTINILGYSGTTIKAVYWSILYIMFITTANYLRTFFRGFEKINYEAVTVIIEKILLCLFGGYALIAKLNVVDFLKLLTLGSFFSIIITAAILFKKLVKPDFSFNLKLICEVFKKSLPFALMNIFILIYFRIDMVMLSIMKNETMVGLYSSSYRIMEMLLVIPAIIMIPIYPAMSRLLINDRLKFWELSQTAVKGMLLVSIPITLMIFFLAHNFMYLFYGSSDYLLATPALKILVFALPFNALTSVFATMLAASNRQILTTRNTSICAGLNIVLNIFLIPQYGFVGASLATIATEGLLAAISYFAVVNYFKEKVCQTYMMKFFSLTLVVLVANIFSKMLDLSVYFATAVSLLFFVAGVFWLGLIEVSVLKLLTPKMIIERFNNGRLSKFD